MIFRRLLTRLSVVKFQCPQNIFIQSTRYRHAQLSYSIIDVNSSTKPPTICPSKPTMLVVHGLFGNKKNFESLAKGFSKQTGIQVVTVDVRNHGSSEHADNMHYEVMAEDMLHLLSKELSIDKTILLGHSMGGKIVMTMALQKPELVRGLVVVDIVPGNSANTENNFFLHLKEKMRSLDFTGVSLIEGKKHAAAELASTVEDKRIIDFLLTNLIEKGGVVKWRLNLPSLQAHYSNIVEFPVSLQSSQYDGPCLFIGGAKSDYIRPEEDKPLISSFFPQASITMVPNAGHWVHAEEPRVFTEHVVRFIRSLN